MVGPVQSVKANNATLINVQNKTDNEVALRGIHTCDFIAMALEKNAKRFSKATDLCSSISMLTRDIIFYKLAILTIIFPLLKTH
jgi:hypothetical protein